MLPSLRWRCQSGAAGGQGHARATGPAIPHSMMLAAVASSVEQQLPGQGSGRACCAHQPVPSLAAVAAAARGHHISRYHRWQEEQQFPGQGRRRACCAHQPASSLAVSAVHAPLPPCPILLFCALLLMQRVQTCSNIAGNMGGHIKYSSNIFA